MFGLLGSALKSAIAAAGVEVFVGVGVAVGTGVAVIVGVSVAAGGVTVVAVADGMRVAVADGALVAVADGALVMVAVADGTPVNVGVPAASLVMLLVPHADKPTASTVAAHQVVTRCIEDDPPSESCALLGGNGGSVKRKHGPVPPLRFQRVARANESVVKIECLPADLPANSDDWCVDSANFSLIHVTLSAGRGWRGPARRPRKTRAFWRCWPCSGSPVGRGQAPMGVGQAAKGC